MLGLVRVRVRVRVRVNSTHFRLLDFKNTHIFEKLIIYVKKYVFGMKLIS